MFFFFSAEENVVEAWEILVEKDFRFYAEEKCCSEKDLRRYEEVCFLQFADFF